MSKSIFSVTRCWNNRSRYVAFVVNDVKPSNIMQTIHEYGHVSAQFQLPNQRYIYVDINFQKRSMIIIQNLLCSPPNRELTIHCKSLVSDRMDIFFRS